MLSLITRNMRTFGLAALGITLLGTTATAGPLFGRRVVVVPSAAYYAPAPVAYLPTTAIYAPPAIVAPRAVYAPAPVAVSRAVYAPTPTIIETPASYVVPAPRVYLQPAPVRVVAPRAYYLYP